MLPSEIKVGDKVTALHAISDGPTEDRPAEIYCWPGEELIVREHYKEGPFPLYVSHPHITDRSFGVQYSDVDIVNAVR